MPNNPVLDSIGYLKKRKELITQERYVCLDASQNREQLQQRYMQCLHSYRSEFSRFGIS